MYLFAGNGFRKTGGPSKKPWSEQNGLGDISKASLGEVP